MPFVVLSLSVFRVYCGANGEKIDARPLLAARVQDSPGRGFDSFLYEYTFLYFSVLFRESFVFENLWREQRADVNEAPADNTHDCRKIHQKCFASFLRECHFVCFLCLYLG